MARHIRAADVAQQLANAGQVTSEWVNGDWDPGYRTTQSGRREVHVFHDGSGEADQLDLYTAVLRASGYQVVAQQMPGGGRRRIAITLP